jgi:hypothetical protein
MAGVCVAAAVVLYLLHRRSVIESRVMWLLFALLALLLIVAAVKPAWTRPFYRAGMTVSFCLGQVVGRILLTALFLVVVTPLGIALRLLGKDLLGLKRKSGASSFWRPVKTKPDLNQQF